MKVRTLKLSHKLLVLAAVPIVFEIVFVSILLTLHNRAEAESAAVAHSRAVATAVTDTDKCLLRGAFSMMVRKDMSGGSLDQCQAALARGKENLAELRTLVQNDEIEASATHRLEILVNRTQAMLTNWQSTGDSPLNTDLLQLVHSLSRETILIADRERSLHQAAPEAEKKARELVVQWLIMGVFISVVLALGLVWFVYRNVVSRLAVLVENTRRIAAEQELVAPIAGSDEIAMVDASMHQAARCLREARQLKQEFVEMVGHDLRTPLTSANFFLSELANGSYGNLPEPIRKRMVAVAADMSRLKIMVTSLLDLDRLETAQIVLDQKTARLSAILSRSVASVQAYAEQQGVTIQLNDTEVLVFADENRLIQVFVNLLSNAAHFSPAGSSIVIHVSETNEYIQIDISDTGPGIAAENVSRIFERYQQAGEFRGGFGLGLAIAKVLTEAHQGHIGVISELGKGSTFYVRLPAS